MLWVSLLGVTQAQAALGPTPRVTAVASFDWNTFDISIIPSSIPANLGYSSQSDSTGVGIDAPGMDVMAGIFPLTSAIPSWGNLLISDSSVGANAEAKTWDGLSTPPGSGLRAFSEAAIGFSGAGAERSADFVMTGSGVAILSLNYNLEVNLDSTANSNTSAFAEARLDLTLTSSASGDQTSSSSFANLNRLFAIAGSGLFARTGTLNLAFTFAAGDTGQFSADTVTLTHSGVALTAVPLPAPLILLGTALAALLFIRRRASESLPSPLSRMAHPEE